MRFVFHVMVLALLVTIAVTHPAPAGAEAVPAAVPECPAYSDSLRRAQAALERGDRETAITALKDAVDALHRCEEAAAVSGPLLG
jgi:hypothetical protein